MPMVEFTFGAGILKSQIFAGLPDPDLSVELIFIGSGIFFQRQTMFCFHLSCGSFKGICRLLRGFLLDIPLVIYGLDVFAPVTGGIFIEEIKHPIHQGVAQFGTFIGQEIKADFLISYHRGHGYHTRKTSGMKIYFSTFKILLEPPQAIGAEVWFGEFGSWKIGSAYYNL